MSITRSIGNAMSGLRAMSRSAELVSRNISNAQTEGYTQKTLALSHSAPGASPGGVRVDGVIRAGDPQLDAARRREEAGAGALSTESDALRRIADALMDPAGGDGLQDRYLAFENAMRALADTPESAALQRGAVESADLLARKLNTLSTDARRLRMDADREIQRQVQEVNRALREIEKLSRDITSARAVGRETSALEDERQRQIDKVNGIVPIKSTTETNGGVQMIAEGGTALLTPSPQLLSFDAAGDPSGFGGLKVAGRGFGSPADLAAATPPRDVAQAFKGLGVGGGSLEALFRVRDEIGADYAAQLDAVARDLVEGFQGLAGYESFYDSDANGEMDSARPGLFTNAGARLISDADLAAAPPANDPAFTDILAPANANEASASGYAAALDGLAGRISINAAALAKPSLLVTPSAATDASPFMVPLTGANAPADTLASALYAEITRSRDAATGGRDVLGLVGSRRPTDMIAEWVSLRESQAGASEREAGFRRGAAEAVREEALAASAVDTDEELRRLLAIEKAYAANARVLQVADDMLATLLQNT